MTNSKTTVPVLVQDPFSGRMLDVYPIFKMLSQFNHDPNLVAGTLDELIREIVCTPSIISHFSGQTNLLNDLYLLRDSFGRCTTIEEGRAQ